jgi:hypothetical protein
MVLFYPVMRKIKHLRHSPTREGLAPFEGKQKENFRKKVFL